MQHHEPTTNLPSLQVDCLRHFVTVMENRLILRKTDTEELETDEGYRQVRAKLVPLLPDVVKNQNGS